MLKLQSIYLFGAVISTIWILTSADHGEYGNDNKFRKSVCENDSDDMHSDMEKCWQLETKPARDASLECLKKTSPDTEHEITAYIKAACKNKEIFHKFDACYEEMMNQASKEEMEVTKEAAECYSATAKKHDLEEIITYFDEI